MITKEQFFEFFNDDEKFSELDVDECLTLFLSSLKGSSDINNETLTSLIENYGDSDVVIYNVIEQSKYGTSVTPFLNRTTAVKFKQDRIKDSFNELDIPKVVIGRQTLETILAEHNIFFEITKSKLEI